MTQLDFLLAPSLPRDVNVQVQVMFVPDSVPACFFLSLCNTVASFSAIASSLPLQFLRK
jgi:hypothetical protein